MAKQDPAKLVKVSLNIFGIGSAEWVTNPAERQAAWALYVELVTRIAVQPLETDDGLLREALSSLYKLFETTREILKVAGPDVGASPESVGGIAIAVLNNGLRPVLAKWHPRLDMWEAQRPAGVSKKAHELAWPDEPLLRQELADLRPKLETYAQALATIAGVR